MEFSQILRDFLTSHNLSQAEFARRIGISQGLCTDWLKGRSQAKQSSLLKISKEFGITVDEFLHISDKNTEIITSEHSTPRHLVLYNSLNADGQEKVDNYISDLAASGLYAKNAPKQQKRDVYDLSKEYPFAAKHAAAAHGNDSNLEEARRIFEESIDKDDDK